MENFLPIIIFVIVVINVLRKVAEFNRNRPQRDADAAPDWPDGAATPPGMRPERPRRPALPRPEVVPSERVRQILEQLAQANGTAPRPPLSAAPEPARRAAAAPLPPPLPSRHAAAAPERRYLSNAALSDRTDEADDGADDERLPPMRSNAKVVRESRAASLPAAPRLPAQGQDRQRRPYAVAVRGRHNLRRAIVLTEVLGRPRAYDV